LDSDSKGNEYQQYFLEGKGGCCIRLTTAPPSCADYLEIWEFHLPGNLRDFPGLLQGLLNFYVFKGVP
jgi:hypothetical protein